MNEAAFLPEAVRRISEMEALFDNLVSLHASAPDVFSKDPSAKALLQKLLSYYEGGQWLRDYELDEQGMLPKNLKRGILSEDAVYDFLSEIADTV